MILRAVIAVFTAFCGLMLAQAADACTYQPVMAVDEEGNIAPAEPVPLPVPAARVKAALPAGLAGEVLVVLPDVTRAVTARDPCLDDRWPWASVTKQVVATIVMQEVERGALSLDMPVSQYVGLPESDFAAPTLRQLLQHRSGLRNPADSTADENGIPEFYSTGPTGLDWCLAERGAVSEEGWRYNNCDYIVVGNVLEAVTGTPIAELIHQRLADAGIHRTTLATRKPHSAVGLDRDFPLDISRYGASGALLGPLYEMAAFDRALLSGKLVSNRSLETLWAGDPQLGYMALGQWSFEVPLGGCDAPVRIIERRGDILAYELRNFILPDNNMALAVAVKDDTIEFGEVWQGSGLSFDLLSALACGDEA